jgi:choline dehydrogenase-like flavoprotein
MTAHGLERDDYEALVIGSGFGGAVAACRLAQAGIDGAIVERGRRYPAGSFPRDLTKLDAGWLWSAGRVCSTCAREETSFASRRPGTAVAPWCMPTWPCAHLRRCSRRSGRTRIAERHWIRTSTSPRT